MKLLFACCSAANPQPNLNFQIPLAVSLLILFRQSGVKAHFRSGAPHKSQASGDPGKPGVSDPQTDNHYTETPSPTL